MPQIRQGAAVVFLRNQLPMPFQQCCRSDDCGDLIENPPAESFGLGGKPPPLVHPTGNGNNEK
jgi:hypothetical protein